MSKPAIETLGHLADEPLDAAHAALEAVTDCAESGLKRLRRQVKHHPLAGLATTFVIGGLVGAVVGVVAGRR